MQECYFRSIQHPGSSVLRTSFLLCTISVAPVDLGQVTPQNPSQSTSPQKPGTSCFPGRLNYPGSIRTFDVSLNSDYSILNASDALHRTMLYN
jgi:hypothetical protein